MSWEKIEKRSITYYKEDWWTTQPAVGINKTGVSFNGHFCRLFGVTGKSQVAFLIDRQANRVGIKICTDEEIIRNEGFAVQDHANKNSSKANNTGTCTVGCARVARAFPSNIGKSYLAKLNPGERVIVVDLYS